MHTHFCAGIVTYTPDPYLRLRVVGSIIDQIPFQVIIDNASENRDEIIYSINGFSKIKLMCNSSNAWIAAAINQIGEFSKAHDCTCFFTLTKQDSLMQVIKYYE